ncbi:hypothetical protein PENSPDRAFT_501421 [Peniophora sp. CONT]|nr:hypothetical protein PENSPDRAFT_501421 [Peniophora sp. CONT]
MVHKPGDQSVPRQPPLMAFHTPSAPRRIQFQQQPESTSLPRLSTDAMPTSERLGASDDPDNKSETEPLASTTSSSHTGTYTSTPVARGTIALYNCKPSMSKLARLLSYPRSRAFYPQISRAKASFLLSAGSIRPIFNVHMGHQPGLAHARVSLFFLRLLVTGGSNAASVDGQIISTGTGVHKHVARDDAADKALKFLREK